MTSRSPSLPPRELVPGEVHVWKASLRQPPEVLRRLERWLPPDERARAARYRFPGLAQAFVSARGLLRGVLALYLNAPPEQIALVYNAHGKPDLDPARHGGEPHADVLRGGEPRGAELRFNLSHSGDVALLAVARGMELGVDVERHRPLSRPLALAQRYFAPREVDTLLALPEHEQPAAFFRCWTRKEAYIKAQGRGLNLPLAEFAVSLARDEPAALLWTAAGEAETRRWRLADLPEAPGYTAALAAAGVLQRVERLEFEFETQ